jgi:hypothetical protein
MLAIRVALFCLALSLASLPWRAGPPQILK